MSRRTLLTGAAALLATAAVPRSPAGATEFITFGGGSTGGSFHIVSAGMARVVEQHVPNVRATARVTAATIENTRLLGQKRIEFALAASSGPYAAVKGKAPFANERYDNIRYVATGYSSPFQIIVPANSPVRTVADLANRRVGVLVGITAQDWFPRIAEVYGIAGRFQQFQLRAAELMTSLRDGNIEVAVFSGAAPTPAITDLATSRSVRFIPIGEERAKQVLETHPFFFVADIPANIYPGQTQPVTSLFNPILLVTRAELPEELVYAVTKVLLDTHHADLKAIHPDAGLFNVENAGKSMVVPIHPGAARFYAEKGIALR
ncbi:TAXI family TRAP transporter solute-binding subunit [Elioraea sp.]|uniref:TAXI family TRAP transporter solute-binding subunit n=1 Tax=Elioraea sp. TaxID=2185103 RepID=UPI003F728462